MGSLWHDDIDGGCILHSNDCSKTVADDYDWLCRSAFRCACERRSLKMRDEIVHRFPETGDMDIRIGSQLIVRESQAAVFFRDGRALDVLGPGQVIKVLQPAQAIVVEGQRLSPTAQTRFCSTQCVLFLRSTGRAGGSGGMCQSEFCQQTARIGRPPDQDGLKCPGMMLSQERDRAVVIRPRKWHRGLVSSLLLQGFAKFR